MRLRSKTELINSIQSEREKLEAKIAGLTSAEIVFSGTMGSWSVKDIMQHLVDWEQRWISWYESGKRGERVVTPEEGYNWRQMGELNELYRQKYLDRPLAAVQEDFLRSYRQIMEMIHSIAEVEMLAMEEYSWTGKLPLIAWIAGNTCDHYRWASQMIHPISIRRKMRAIHDM